MMTAQEYEEKYKESKAQTTNRKRIALKLIEQLKSENVTYKEASYILSYVQQDLKMMRDRQLITD